MSNYIFEKRKNKNSIKNYIIVNGRIHINYWNGRVRKKLYSEEEESRILNTIDLQSEDSINHKKEIEKELRKRKNDLSVELMCVVMGSILVLIGSPIYIAIMTGIASVMVANELRLVSVLQGELNRILKYDIFIDDEMFLNPSKYGLDMKNEKSLCNEKSTNKLNTFTVNTINSYSLKNLKKIRNDIFLGYGITIPKEKKKILSFKKEKQNEKL